MKDLNEYYVNEVHTHKDADKALEGPGAANIMYAKHEVDERIAKLSKPLLSPQKRQEFESLTRPLIKFLNDETHPHTKIIIECDSAELVSGETAYTTTEYIRD